MNLEFKNITVDMGQRRILDNVSLRVEPGTVTGLIGPNGSGKSTLLKTAYRVQPPTQGAVFAGGKDVASLSSVEAARRIAVMAQEISSDFPLTGREVAMLGRVPHQRGFGADSPRDIEIVETALVEVGAQKFADRTFSSLSGGEKQRILLARVLAQENPVLILDEPTSHADLGFQHELLHLVTARGGTTLAALHDVNLALAYCDRVAVLQAGKLVAHGPVTSVLVPDLVDEVLGVESVALDDPRGGHALSFRRHTRL